MEFFRLDLICLRATINWNRFQNHTKIHNMEYLLAAYQITEGDPLSDNILKWETISDKHTYLSLQNGQYVMINNYTLTPVD